MTIVSTLIPLLTFALVTSATPGPNNVMLMSSGMNFGFKRSVAHMAGVVIGFPIMIVLIGTGLMQLFESVAFSLPLLKLISIVYLLYLAWRIANTKSINTETQSTKPLTFIQAALFQWVNPKGWAMALTAVSVYTPQTQPLYSILLVATAFALTGVFSTSFWTLTGQQLKRFLHDPIKLRAINIILAALLVLTLLPVFINDF